MAKLANLICDHGKYCREECQDFECDVKKAMSIYEEGKTEITPEPVFDGLFDEQPPPEPQAPREECDNCLYCISDKEREENR